MTHLASRPREWRPHLRPLAPFLVLIALAGVFQSVAPSFLTGGNLRAILLSASILLIVSMGSALIILMGSIDLSVGAIATFCGMVVALLVPTLGLGAVFAGVLIGFALGLLNGLIYVFLRIPSILVTLGTATTLSGAVLLLSDGASIPIRDDAFLGIAQGSLLPFLPNAAVIAILFYLLMVHVGERTRFGRMTLAIGSDEHTAALIGVKVNRVKIQAFAVSGALAGVAGTLLAARLGTGTASMGSYMMLDSITAVVVGGTAITGGVGGVRLTILGVLIMASLANGMNIVALHPYLQTIIQGGVIVLAVMFMSERPPAKDVK